MLAEDKLAVLFSDLYSVVFPLVLPKFLQFHDKYYNSNPLALCSQPLLMPANNPITCYSSTHAHTRNESHSSIYKSKGYSTLGFRITSYSLQSSNTQVYSHSPIINLEADRCIPPQHIHLPVLRGVQSSGRKGTPAVRLSQILERLTHTLLGRICHPGGEVVVTEWLTKVLFLWNLAGLWRY